MSRNTITPEELKKREEQFRQARAIKYILQGIRYIMGYLPDYPFDIRPVFTENPISITLRIYWGIDVEAWDNMPTVVKEKIEKLERDLSNILHTVEDSEISKPIGQDRAD